ncbi:hypothetical protein V7S43_014273 [Phytophthora oleae]|uniref:ZSWIM3 N-terminal domain-containing protein n=1 Tax=Phytophthora oleae TaxID=2107226 RepID=A0ABD3F3D5_9STRA
MEARKRRAPPRQESASSEDNEASDDSESWHSDSSHTQRVPSLLNQEFVTWQEFTDGFKKHSEDTYQTYANRTSTSRAARNKRVTKHYQDRGEEPPDSELFHDETFPYYIVSYECTYAGKYRNRGKGKRPRQKVRSIGCKAKLNVLLQREEDSYHLKISMHQTSHNHSLGKYSHKRLPKKRLQLPAEELATVDMLRKAGLSRKKILRYIWDNTSSEHGRCA